MLTLITVVHVLVCIFLCLVILLQAGRGGGMGVAFGAGTSSAVFGGKGAGSFLEKLTVGSAVVFMLTSVALAFMASQTDSKRLENLTAQRQHQKAAAKKAADEQAQKEAAERAKENVPPAATPKSTAPATP